MKQKVHLKLQKDLEYDHNLNLELIQESLVYLLTKFKELIEKTIFNRGAITLKYHHN